MPDEARARPSTTGPPPWNNREASWPRREELVPTADRLAHPEPDPGLSAADDAAPSWRDVFSQVESTPPRRAAEPRWRELFERLDRIEAHQADLTGALWAEVHRRLDRIELQQAELEKMALALAGALQSAGAGGLALGSPIDPLPPPRPAGDRPEVELASIGLSAAAGPDAPEGSTPARSTEEMAPLTPAEASPDHHRPAPPKPPADATEATTEPAWLRAPLPDAFVTARPVGRRRWFFGRRRDYVVTAAPDPFWPSGPTGGLAAPPPPPPPGFDWSGAGPTIPDPAPVPQAERPAGTHRAEPPSPLEAESAGRPQDR
jgi:hypothetical protein